MKRCLSLIPILFIAVAGFGQSDRGTITGTVTDPQGLPVPSVEVVAVNMETRTEQRTITTETGNFTIPQLPAGVYEVTMTLPGFKKYVQQGITVQVAQTQRVDVKLQLGTPEESVTVEADAPLLKTDSGEVSHNFNVNRFDSLPISGVTSGNLTLRSPYSFLSLMPGAVFNGSNNMRIMGQTNSAQIRIEGQESGNSISATNFQMVQPGVDSLQEVSLQTSNYSAEFGQAQGGLINFTSKSGTNQFHGSLYDYFTNDALDAGYPFTDNGEGGHVRPPSHKHDFGFSAGGPVYIPKIYNGRNRTFFFIAYEQLRYNVGNFAGGLTIPTVAMREGNFSGVLGGKIGTDPLGRDILLNQIYDPATERTLANQVTVRDPFPGNKIPANRISPVAKKIQAYIPMPIRAGNAGNWDYSWKSPRVAGIGSYKIDHDMGTKGRLSWYHQFGSADARRQTGGAGNEGLPDPVTQGRDNRQTPKLYRLSYDISPSPRILIHAGAGYQSLKFEDRQYRDYADPVTGESGPLPDFNSYSLLGLKGAVATGFPRFTGLQTTYGGMATMGAVSNAVNIFQKPSAVLSATYVRGNHTFKAGADWRIEAVSNYSITGSQGIYNFGAAATGLPYLQSTQISGQSLGFPYASFMLGLIESASVRASNQPQYRRSVFATFVQDSWKVNRKLTLDLGIRWDRQAAGHEIYYRTSRFAPKLANPAAGGLPGAVEYEGYGSGRCNCTFSDTYGLALGPRFGLAYQISEKTVLRAGWGISYGAVPGTISSNALLGVGWDTVNFTNPAFGYPGAKLDTGLIFNPADMYTPSYNPGIRPTPGQTDSPGPWLDAQVGRPSRANQWSIGVQRAITPNLMVEAAYVANRMVWMQANTNLTDINGNTAERLAAFGLDITKTADQTLLTQRMNSTAVINRGFKAPYPGFPMTATLAQALRPYPQFSGIAVSGSPLGKSWYDSLQAKLTKRYSHGLELTVSYTFQKELQVGETAAVVDAHNYDYNKYISANSQPQSFAVAFNYKVPMWGKGRVMRAIVSDWTLAGALRYASGLPILVPYSNNNLNNLLLRQNSPATYANRVPGQNPFLKDLNCHCFDPSTNLVFNPAAWSDPPAGQFGTSAPYYSDYRYQRRPQESLALGRIFRIYESMQFEVRAQFFNVFNRTQVSDPTGTNFAAKPTIVNGQYRGGFGYINTGSLAQLPRYGQIVARITW